MRDGAGSRRNDARFLSMIFQLEHYSPKPVEKNGENRAVRFSVVIRALVSSAAVNILKRVSMVQLEFLRADRSQYRIGNTYNSPRSLGLVRHVLLALLVRRLHVESRRNLHLARVTVKRALVRARLLHT